MDLDALGGFYVVVCDDIEGDAAGEGSTNKAEQSIAALAAEVAPDEQEPKRAFGLRQSSAGRRPALKVYPGRDYVDAIRRQTGISEPFGSPVRPGSGDSHAREEAAFKPEAGFQRQTAERWTATIVWRHVV
ncbi:MAG: hypothetical protein U5Q44_01570 [Dehalococcoidia bacterium]|nr:hypothetical protein [Dehalococcoidia bacterium]